MDLHKLRVLKFDDHASRNAALINDCGEANDISHPINDSPKPPEDNKTLKFMRSVARMSRPRKRIRYCKKRKSASDVSLSSQNELKKHTRKRSLSLIDVKESFKNSMNCYPIKHTFDLLSGDSELHIRKKRHGKKRKRQNKINKDIKIMFICETPRISRKSRKRPNKRHRKESSNNWRSSDDIFGFQKSNRASNQYLYHAKCNYFNTFRKFKMGLQSKKKCSEPQPRRKHTRVRVLSTDYLSSIESSLKHYNIVNTCKTNHGQKCVKLHSYNGRKTDNLCKRSTVDAKVSVAPSSLAKIGKSFCNSSVGTSKSFIRRSCSNGPRCHYCGTQNQQNGMRRLSHKSNCPHHGTAHSLHKKLKPLEDSACICTQYPSGSDVDAVQCGTNQINQTDQHTCETRICLDKHYARLYARVLEKMLTTLSSKSQCIAKSLLKYALLGLLIIIWCPCIFVIGFAWIITYPLKLQHVISVDKAKKPSNIFCLFSKFRKNHREDEDGSYPKRRGFLSWLSNWSSRAANNIAKSINTLLSIFKINKNNPVSESSFYAPKHPNRGRKYSLFYETNRGWVMKPRSQELSTLYHRNQVLQNVRHGCRLNAIRQKLARNKRHERQGSSLFRCPPTTNIRAMPTCWETKPVLPETLPSNQVMTLPKPLNVNLRHARKSIYTAKKQQNRIMDKSQMLNNNTTAPPGRNSLFGMNASHRPSEIRSKETSNRKSSGAHKNIQFRNKCTKSTQYISSQNVAIARQYPTRRIASYCRPKCAKHPKPYRFPNQQTKLLPNTYQIQNSEHQSGLRVLYQSKNSTHNLPSNSISVYSSNSMSADKSDTHLSKHIQNTLSPRHVHLKNSPYQISLTKLLHRIDKLSKYLEQTRLTDRCSSKQTIKDSHRLEYARKQQSSILPSTTQFVPSMSVITNYCKCSNDSNISNPTIPNKTSHSSCSVNRYSFPSRKNANLIKMKQPTNSLAIKCVCVNKEINRHLQNSTDERASAFPAKKLRRCLCPPHKQALANKSSHQSSKTVTSKQLKCTCPKDGRKDSLECPSYLPKELSPRSQSSKVTKYSARTITRSLRKTVDKLRSKNKHSVSSNVCLDDLVKAENKFDKHRKQHIKDNKTIGCPYCDRRIKLGNVVCECPQDFPYPPNKRQDSGNPNKKQILREDSVCKCQIKKQHLLSQYFFFNKKRAEKNSSTCECAVNKPSYKRNLSQQDPDFSVSRSNRVICECPSDKKTVSECPTKESIFRPRRDLKAKKQIDKNYTECECSLHRHFNYSQSKRNNASENVKRNHPLCKGPTEKPILLPNPDKSNTLCECPLHKQVNSQTHNKKQKMASERSKRDDPLCECPTEELQFIPHHKRSTGKNKIKQNSTHCECLDKNSQFQTDKLASIDHRPKQGSWDCQCPSEETNLLPQEILTNKKQTNQNRRPCPCKFYNSKFQSKEVDSDNFKRSDPLCECSREKATFKPGHGKDNTLCQCPLHKQKLNSESHKNVSEKIKRDDPLCECPTEELQFKNKRNSTICECLDENTAFQPDELDSTHHAPTRNSLECECPSEETLTNKHSNQSKGPCPCRVYNSHFLLFKVPSKPSKNDKGKDVVCECPSVKSQSPSKISRNKSPTKLVRGSKVKCTCSGGHSTSQHNPYHKGPLRSRKPVDSQAKLVTREVTKTSRQPIASQCACSHEKTKHLDGKQSNNSIKSGNTINLKRSFEKLHFKLSRYFSNHVDCTCSSEKVILDQVPQRAVKKTSDHLQTSNSREKISRYLRKSVSKIHTKLPSHLDCTCSDNLKRTSGKESQNLVKSGNESSQRVRFEPLDATNRQPVSRQPKPATSHKCVCADDKPQLLPGSQSYHPLKLQTAKTRLLSSEHLALSQRAGTSSKEKITNTLRNTIDKSDVECMCSDKESDHSLNKDSQHQLLPDRTEKKNSKLVLSKRLGDKCSCKHDKLSPHNKTLVDQHNGLFQYPTRQQAISPAQQRISADQVPTTKCFCSKEVQHRSVEASSHPIHRMHAMSTQWIQSTNDPCRLPLRYQSPSPRPLPCQPIFRSQHRLSPQAVNICTPTCISKRRRPWPPGSRLDYPTLFPDALCRRYAVDKQMLNRPECKKKQTRKQRNKSFRKTFCNYCSKIKQSIVNADADMWPNNLHCDGRMYIHTLRKKPCYCIFKYCPSMYPCVLTICSLTKSVCTMFLYVVALICWCPFFCCVCLLCEDICCCLRRR